jgi:hypothetical protein
MVPAQYWVIERLKRRMKGLPVDDPKGDFVVHESGH